MATAAAAVSAGSVANGTFTTIAAGSYELQAVYTGDANNNGATSAGRTEPFTVTKSTPTLTTTRSASTAPSARL